MKTLSLIILTSASVLAFIPYPSYCRRRTAGQKHALQYDNGEDSDTSFCTEKDIASARNTSRKTEGAINRRESIAKALTISAAIFGSSLLVSTKSAQATALEDVQIGGRWVPIKDEAAYDYIAEDETIIPSYFAVYLSRILINYDVAVESWWDDQTEAYSLLPAADVRYKLGRSFGGFAASVQAGAAEFVQTVARSDGDREVINSECFERLGRVLLNNYDEGSANNSEIARQLGILFSLLPAKDQPTKLLKELNRRQIRQEIKQFSSSEKNGNVWEVISKGTVPVGFTENERSLLPTEFGFVRCSDNSYCITPKITLWEIGVDEEFGQTAVGTVFGPVSSVPLNRNTPDIGINVYKLLGLSGAAACALTHTVVIPLDVVKTRLQTNPGQYSGFVDGVTTIARDEGVSALSLGAQATIAGFLWYGLSVYPSYDLFKRLMSNNLAPSYASVHVNDIALLAGALASVVACIGLAPAETCRIRTVADPDYYQPLGFAGTLASISNEDPVKGWRSVYAGFSSILVRQVIFGSVKFFSFERACEAIYSAYPVLKDTTVTTLAVSLVAGGLAGSLSSIVSQPADSILTYCAQSSKNYNILEGCQVMVREEGAGSLFRGLGSRCLWAGSIIAGQFFLYSVFREVFSVTAADLTEQFQVFLSTQ